MIIKDTSAFLLKCISVMDFLEKSNVFLRNHKNESLSDDNSFKRAKSLLKGIKFNVTHDENNKRTYTVDGLHLNSTSYYFENEMKSKISVEEHFRETLKKPLKYPHLPCLLTRSGPRMLAFPIEVCKIAKEQRLVGKLSRQEQSKQRPIKLEERLEKTRNFIKKVTHSSISFFF